ncbi:MAG: DUF3179 domain-containing protein [bacterium]|nr:DUF3179 domain-containing protein [bacterium]
MERYKYFMLSFLVVFGLLFLSYCNTKSSPGGSGGEWLIDEGQVQDGGPGKDGIPALQSPNYIAVQAVDFLAPEALVIGLRIGDQVVAFPHPIMDYHEIVNDIVDDVRVILSYCPLTGSAMAWRGDGNASNYTFGVSGLLYNSNLILYDRETSSNWAQMMIKCVNGDRIREIPAMIHVIETSWATWQQLYPNSLVVSLDTGYARNYFTYPYGDYKTSSGLLFSVSNDDSRLHKKERVHGVFISESSTKVYPIASFTGTTALQAEGAAEAGDIMVINDSFGGVDLVAVGSANKNFAVTFERGGNAPQTFMAVQNQLPVVMMDDEGTMWDIFGHGVSGPRAGDQLTPTTSYNAYWFAWAAFFPNTEIYQ